SCGRERDPIGRDATADREHDERDQYEQHGLRERDGELARADESIHRREEQRIRGRTDHLRREARRVGEARELSGRREDLSEAAVSLLIGPLRRPVGPLIPDEEEAVQRSDEADEPQGSPSRHVARLYRVTTAPTAAPVSRRRRIIFTLVAVLL